MAATKRDSSYATLRKQACLPLGNGNEARIEQLYIKALKSTEIRLSWWKDGRMMMRPLDLAEADLMKLLAEGIRKGVIMNERPQRKPKS